MAIAAVSTWLAAGEPFAPGVALLKELGCADSALLYVLSLGETSLAKVKLRKALLAIQEPLLQAEIARQAPQLQPVAVAVRQDRDLEPAATPAVDLSPEMELVRKSILQNYREEQHLRGRLRHMPDRSARYDAARRILELYLDTKAKWARIDHWTMTGVDLAAPRTEQLSTAEELRRIGTLRTYLSKAKKGKRVYPEEKLRAFQDELAALETKHHVVRP